ncbi:hypothetical protein EDM56_09675 [Brevibacillus fluminis]|uniref:Uncharacterized protein n=1 Tax=Brevibacillus fluminis TaxID=511487 RepID=A0A3M8DMY7_9BACL|nr:hypothetical protein EDM56_09675 [Brevibacillus fluminis]
MNVHGEVQTNATQTELHPIINLHDELREKIVHLTDEANQGESLGSIDYFWLSVAGLVIPAAILILAWML